MTICKSLVKAHDEVLLLQREKKVGQFINVQVEVLQGGGGRRLHSL